MNKILQKYISKIPFATKVIKYLLPCFQALHFLIVHRQHIVKIFIPLSPAFIVFSMTAYLLQGAPMIKEPLLMSCVILVCGILCLPFFTSFLVAIHRGVLQGASHKNIVNPLSLHPSEKDYLLALFLLFCLFALLYTVAISVFFASSLFISEITFLKYGIGFLICVFFAFGISILLRLSLCLPAAAIEKNISWGGAIVASKAWALSLFLNTIFCFCLCWALKSLCAILAGYIVAGVGYNLGTTIMDSSTIIEKVLILIFSLPFIALDYVFLALFAVIIALYFKNTLLAQNN